MSDSSEMKDTITPGLSGMPHEYHSMIMLMVLRDVTRALTEEKPDETIPDWPLVVQNCVRTNTSFWKCMKEWSPRYREYLPEWWCDEYEAWSTRTRPQPHGSMTLIPKDELDRMATRLKLHLLSWKWDFNPKDAPPYLLYLRAFEAHRTVALLRKYSNKSHFQFDMHKRFIFEHQGQDDWARSVIKNTLRSATEEERALRDGCNVVPAYEHDSSGHVVYATKLSKEREDRIGIDLARRYKMVDTALRIDCAPSNAGLEGLLWHAKQHLLTDLKATYIAIEQFQVRHTLIIMDNVLKDLSEFYSNYKESVKIILEQLYRYANKHPACSPVGLCS